MPSSAAAAAGSARGSRRGGSYDHQLAQAACAHILKSARLADGLRIESVTAQSIEGLATLLKAYVEEIGEGVDTLLLHNQRDDMQVEWEG